MVGYVENVEELEIGELDGLRRENEALRRELEWTRVQHARWARERKDLIVRVRELRVHDLLDDAERQRLIQMEAECLKLAKGFEEAQAWSGELRRAVDWSQEQNRKLEAAMREKDEHIVELEKARDWYAEQSRRWEELFRSSQNPEG
jgi:hypothetical protein